MTAQIESNGKISITQGHQTFFIDYEGDKSEMEWFLKQISGAIEMNKMEILSNAETTRYSKPSEINNFPTMPEKFNLIRPIKIK